jgi:hypothetical protein
MVMAWNILKFVPIHDGFRITYGIVEDSRLVGRLSAVQPIDFPHNNESVSEIAQGVGG